MSTTYFAAALKCSHCGQVSPDDTSTGMVSHLLDEPGLQIVRARDPVELDHAAIAAAFYKLRELPSHGPIVLFQDWCCPSCGQTGFARVTFEGRRVTSIKAAASPALALDTAHLATARLPEIYEQFTGERFYVDGAIRPDFLRRLRNALPASEENRSLL